MILDKTRDGLVLELAMIQHNLPLIPFGVGGMVWGRNHTTSLRKYLLQLIVGEVMDIELDFLKLNDKNWLMN